MKIRLKIILTLMLAAVLMTVLLTLYCLPGHSGKQEVSLSVLMYHHFLDDAYADTIVTPGRFREQMTALKEAGYTTVTLQQVADFVDHGIALPEKAVLITMDDGYTSNLTVAAPILEELGLCATVFMIGIYEGETTSPHTGNPLYPARFGYEEAMEWVEKGVLDLQTHTFDMHQQATDGFSGRSGILQMKGERMEDYCAALAMDAERFAQRRQAHGLSTPLIALAYPYGFFDDASRETLRKAGIRFTFTVEETSNQLRVGDESCLWNMGRFNMTDRCSGADLVRLLEDASG